MPSNSSTLTPPALTALDRCDASQAEQATQIFVKTGHHSLMFCDYHARKYGADLTADGWYAGTDPVSPA